MNYVPTIHHVQIAIPPIGEESARAFYGGLLDLIEIDKPTNLRSRGGVWLRTGNLELHLGVDRDFRPAAKAHVAFQVKDLDAYRRRIQQAGYPITEDEPLPGFSRFYIEDPFGNRVELLEVDEDRR